MAAYAIKKIMEINNISETISVYEEENQVFVKHKKVTTKGFSAAVFYIFQNILKRKLDLHEQALLFHWTSFCSSELFKCCLNKQELINCQSYINLSLKDRVFFGGFSPNVVDEVMLIILEDYIHNWTPREKEKFINTCRWYSSIREKMINSQANAMIFSKTRLYSCTEE